jgi:N-glycosylase/DNA lyase
MIKCGEVKIEELAKIKELESLKAELLKLDGVGEKVADCVMLFSNLRRLDAFPVDVWVRRVMNELYIKSDDEKKLNNDYIRKIAEEKYENLAGIAQQYLFYWRREKGA